MSAVRYIGIRPTSQIPDYAAYTEFSHTEDHRGQTVYYFHVYVPDRPDVNPTNPNVLDKGWVSAFNSFLKRKAREQDLPFDPLG